MAMFPKKLFSINIFNVSYSILNVQRRGIKRYVRPTILALKKREKTLPPIPIEKTKRSNFIEWNHNAELYAFGKRLGEEFNIEKLLRAFIHRSYIVQEELKQEQVGIQKPDLGLEDNKKYAEEGEKIISAEIKKFLIERFPRLPLECVQCIHDYLLSNATLAAISKSIGTTDLILSADYPVEEPTLAQTLKAVVGALVASQDLERGNRFVREIILTHLAEKDLNDLFEIPEPLETLKNILARDGLEPPEPRIIGQSAMNDILASYTIGIYSDKRLIGQGPGETLEIAVDMAARDALKRLFGTTESSTPLRFDGETSGAHAVKSLPLSKWKSSAFAS